MISLQFLRRAFSWLMMNPRLNHSKNVARKISLLVSCLIFVVHEKKLTLHFFHNYSV